ncbi:hypothetical protein [Variovorax boronicumulans]|uniref:hypothetical protein n=1 Tax=Variovorax boronicumulans TaxID=436515 RepID=UPI00085BBE92|nr:hypothetical protein [Variovorax boronicumulans]OEZ31085.1 hypothetical protein AO062_09200 [Variovorax boronicumulans]
MNFKPAAVAAATAALLALTACGGGGSGGGGGGFVLPPPAPPPAPAPAPAPAPTPAPAPAPAPNPGATTFLYEGLSAATTASAFFDSLAAQGARGFRFLSGFSFMASPTTVDQVDGFVKTIDATYSYEKKPQATSNADLLNQLNEAGARGFQWAGEWIVGGETFYFYRKSSAETATYSYRVELAPKSKADYLTQANTQGASGFFNRTAEFGTGDPAGMVTVYEKSSVGNATFAYEMGDPINDHADYLAQFNERGARGFRFRAELIFAGGNGVLYAKDLSQSTTFNFYSLAPATNTTALIQQANAEGAKKAALLGHLALSTGEQKAYYFTPTNCNASPVCGPTSLFGF